MLDDLNHHILFLNNYYVVNYYVVHFSTFDPFLERIRFNPDLMMWRALVKHVCNMRVVVL